MSDDLVMREPRKVPGVENRLRHRRDGTPYWTFRVRWTDPATGGRVGEEFDDQQDAIDLHAAVRLARRGNSLIELSRGRQTLAEFVELEWWPKYAAKKLARNTLPSYAAHWNRHLLPHVGHLELRRLTAPAVQQLAEDLEASACGTCQGSRILPAKTPGDPARDCFACNGRGTLGTATVRKSLAILQSICRYAVTRGEMPQGNVVKEIEKPTVEKQLSIVAISPAQVELLLAELDTRSAMLCELLAYEGLRPEEALALEDRHVAGQALLVEQKNVQGTIVAGLKRRRKSRTRDNRTPKLWAPVRQDLAAYRLATQLERKPDQHGRQLLFPRPDGEPWTDTDYRNWRRRVFKPAVERAGIPITRPYDCRHSCASLLIRAAWPLTEAAAFMGHTVQTLSDDYAHEIADMQGQPPVDPEQAILNARNGDDAQEAV